MTRDNTVSGCEKGAGGDVLVRLAGSSFSLPKNAGVPAAGVQKRRLWGLSFDRWQARLLVSEAKNTEKNTTVQCFRTVVFCT